MRYVEYRDAIEAELRRNAGGLTWAQLQARLGLPYDRPCSTWTRQLENEIGLQRKKGAGRSLVWQLRQRRRAVRTAPYRSPGLHRAADESATRNESSTPAAAIASVAGSRTGLYSST